MCNENISEKGNEALTSIVAENSRKRLLHVKWKVGSYELLGKGIAQKSFVWESFIRSRSFQFGKIDRIVSNMNWNIPTQTILQEKQHWTSNKTSASTLPYIGEGFVQNVPLFENVSKEFLARNVCGTGEEAK